MTAQSARDAYLKRIEDYKAKFKKPTAKKAVKKKAAKKKTAKAKK